MSDGGEGDGRAPVIERSPGRASNLGAPQDAAALQARLAAAEAFVLDLKNRILKLQEVERALQAERVVSLTLQRRMLDAEHALAVAQKSVSWRLTAPLRMVSGPLRRVLRLARRVAAWLLFKEGSKPRRIVLRLLQRVGPVDDGLATRYLFVDHTIGCQTNTGIQRVVRGLAKSMLQSGLPVRFVKWDPVLSACVLINADERAYLGRWNGPESSPDEAAVYQPKGAPLTRVAHRRRAGDWLIVPEVTHMTSHAAPVTAALIRWAKTANLKAGFIFYDAIPMRRPEFAALAPIHARYMHELKSADAVWPISRWSADELVSLWDVAEDADRADLPTVRPIHLPSEFDRPRALDAVTGDKQILCVGTVEPRKNQTALIRAFQQILLERPDLGDWRLTLAGNLHPAVAEEVTAATAPGSPVEYLGHVADDRLSDLYANCAFTVFPSLDEGFGLPILESLWSGKPCLCANFGAMGEVAAGGGCLTVDMRDPAEIKSALERLMDDADLRRALAEAAAARSMTHWNDYLAELEIAVTGGESLIYFWVDATVHFPVNTGIQRVVRQLARGLIEAGHRLVPVKWGDDDQAFQAVTEAELELFARWNGPTPDQWAPWKPPQDHRGGGWFIMAELPLQRTDAQQKRFRKTAEAAGLKSAAVFYDTIPWKMRETYPPAFANAHRLYIRELANYDLVLSISQYSRDEMICVLEEEFQLAHHDLGHVQACLLPAEFPERAAEGEARRQQGVIEIVSVGTVEPRKNHERLLDAFELASQASAPPLYLTLVGGSMSYDPEFAERVRVRVASNPNMDWVEDADDACVQRMYSLSDFTVYPSIEEGFGLPILESLWYGKPCICANFGSMLEVAAEGGGCVTVDVSDPQAMAAAICELANSPARLDQLVEEAKARVFRSWRDYARVVWGRLDLWSRPSREEVRARREAMGQGVG